MNDRSEQPWWVYMLECSDGAIYTGIAIDLEARYRAHVSGKGAKYTRMNPPRKILAAKLLANRQSAAREEFALKQMAPTDKRQWALMNRFDDR